MSRRSDKGQSESTDIPTDGRQYVTIRFAGIATSCADLPHFETLTEKSWQIPLGSEYLLSRVASYDQIFSSAYGQLVVPGEFYGLVGTGRFTFSTEKATAHVKLEKTFDPRDSIGRANLNAGFAIRLAFGVMNLRTSPEAGRQWRCGTIRVFYGPITLIESGCYGLEHAMFLKVVAAIREIEALVA